MSNTFKAGVTYKFKPELLIFMKLLLSAEFAGEDGVFTVAEVNEDGTIFTDDITSPKTTHRCKIPANIVEDCTVVSSGNTQAPPTIKIEVGKTYKLVDISKEPKLAEAVSFGGVVLPEDGIVTIHSIELGKFGGEQMGCSHTLGCGGTCNQAEVAGDFIAIGQAALDNGAFEEVLDVLH